MGSTCRVSAWFADLKPVLQGMCFAAVCQETAHMAQLIARQRAPKKTGRAKMVNCHMRVKSATPFMLHGKNCYFAIVPTNEKPKVGKGGGDHLKPFVIDTQALKRRNRDENTSPAWHWGDKR